MRLTDRFLPHHRGPDVAMTPDEKQALETRLAALIQDGRAAWPGVSIPPSLFLRYVAERLPEELHVLPALERLHGSDLYLACACAVGDDAGLRYFDEHFVSQIDLFLARQRATPAFCDEVRQTVRHRLLVANRGAEPRIAGYTGRGPLGGWLRAAALRVATDLRRAGKRHAARTDNVSMLGAHLPDPELQLLKTRYAADVRACMEAALAQISPKERLLLRLAYLDEVPPENIAQSYRVHRTTVVRWLATIREQILKETRRRLGERLKIQASQLDSLIGAVHSQLEVSVARLLKTTDR
jgi:RNA polymerase sigma-70 factor, ECF subfamily